MRDSTFLKLFSGSLNHTTAVGIVILLWIAYTVLQTLFVTGHVNEVWSAILGFIPGFCGAVILYIVGLSREQLYLRFESLSFKGLGVLISIFVFVLAAVLPFGTWQGWNWRQALVFAPASGVSQELFFRCVLLPALVLGLKQRIAIALFLHSLLFALWHIGPLFMGAPLWAVIAVMLVPFVSGIGWGWQVRHDRTALWAMLQHSLIWVIAGQFPVSG